MKTITITTTPTSSPSNQGLTTSSKLGVGIGIPFAIIFIGLLIWIGLILRKREVKQTEPTVQAESISRFKDKVELPTHAGVASGSHSVGELP